MLTPTALAAEEISSHEPQPTIQTELISENFYQAVNNQWLSQTEMPADQSFYGQFAVAQDRLDTVLQADLAKMAAGEVHPESPKAQGMIAYYRLAADFNQREADGISQARRLLAQVEQLTSFKDFEELSQDDLLRFTMLLWEFYVSPNMQDTQHYALWLATPTTFLPDKSFNDGLNPAKK